MSYTDGTKYIKSPVPLIALVAPSVTVPKEIKGSSRFESTINLLKFHVTENHFYTLGR